MRPVTSQRSDGVDWKSKKPWNSRAFVLLEATGGFEPPNEGFADLRPQGPLKYQISRKSVPEPGKGLQAYLVVPLRRVASCGRAQGNAWDVHKTGHQSIAKVVR